MRDPPVKHGTRMGNRFTSTIEYPWASAINPPMSNGSCMGATWKTHEDSCGHEPPWELIYDAPASTIVLLQSDDSILGALRSQGIAMGDPRKSHDMFIEEPLEYLVQTHGRPMANP